MKNLILALAAAATLAAPAAAAPGPEAQARPAIGSEARIPFVNFRTVRSFYAPSDEVVFLQDRSRNWYRAQLIGNCFGLRWANRIGFDTRGSSTLDRFSAILVEGERCQLQSLTRSEKPERRSTKRS
jgi:hypothetical protein